jgi:hypothetical protein
MTEEVNDVTNVPGSPKRPTRNKRIVLIIVLVLILVAATSAVWWFLIKKNDTNGTTTKMTSTTTLDTFIKPATGETWDNPLVPIADPGYISPSAESNTKFYEVGKRGTTIIIMAVSQYIGYDIELFERSTNGKVSYIEYPNNLVQKTKDTATVTGHYDNTQWTSKVTIDKVTHYDSLTLPANFSLNSTESVSIPANITLGDFISGNMPDNTVTTTVLKTYGSNSLVKIERKYVDTGLTSINYAINTPIGTQIALAFQPINPKIDNYAWDNNVKTTGTIGGIVRGCGIVGDSVSRTDVLGDGSFTPIGKSDSGITIYGIKDSKSSIVQKAYSEYKDYNTFDGSLPIVSFDTFIANHAIFAYKSSSDGWLIYTIDTYASIGGCAQPIVYLNPTQTESVNVRFGANV